MVCIDRGLWWSLWDLKPLGTTPLSPNVASKFVQMLQLCEQFFLEVQERFDKILILYKKDEKIDLKKCDMFCFAWFVDVRHCNFGGRVFHLATLRSNKVLIYSWVRSLNTVFLTLKLSHLWNVLTGLCDMFQSVLHMGFGTDNSMSLPTSQPWRFKGSGKSYWFPFRMLN